MIVITPNISIDESEIIERFARASGPGGQHVNKTSTAVELRFDIRRSPNIPDAVAVRAMRLAGSKLTQDGEIVIFAQEHRSQLRNREAALERLIALIAEAAPAPVKRRPTKPSKGQKEKRLAGKAVRSGVKQGRSRVRAED
jgi:ribosome-associated protein